MFQFTFELDTKWRNGSNRNRNHNHYPFSFYQLKWYQTNRLLRMLEVGNDNGFAFHAQCCCCSMCCVWHNPKRCSILNVKIINVRHGETRRGCATNGAPYSNVYYESFYWIPKQTKSKEFPLVWRSPQIPMPVFVQSLYRNVMECTRINHNNKSKMSDRNSVIQMFSPNCSLFNSCLGISCTQTHGKYVQDCISIKIITISRIEFRILFARNFVHTVGFHKWTHFL